MPTLFLETMRIYGGQVCLLSLHLERMMSTAKAMGFVLPGLPHFSDLVHDLDPAEVYKCRLLYGRDMMELEAPKIYTKRTVKTLALLEIPRGRSYRYKYAERSWLSQLSQEQEVDEVVLMHSSGALGDSSYSNLAFCRDGRWYTPDTPLLEGVQRRFLMEQGQIVPARIRRQDLTLYSHVGLINAMMPLESMVVLPITALRM